MDHPRAGHAHRSPVAPRIPASYLVRAPTRTDRQKSTGMSDPHSASGAGRFEVRATADSHFGWIRTRLSVERTMMSWQRTAVALIGFGFAIVQYFNRLQEIPGARTAYLPTVPGYLALA